jgi:hypothetical protein
LEGWYYGFQTGRGLALLWQFLGNILENQSLAPNYFFEISLTFLFASPNWQGSARQLQFSFIPANVANDTFWDINLASKFTKQGKPSVK